ncbi:phage tail protein [Deinococcus arcticus]|uniref:Phage tail protein n=1 Tax=Deinococcus arcticus TaxID=2136176 RepID=A0A2T3W9D4_9DEIO|nr:tail fiber protein [Deinococcus arcticus]PTA68505.1 phage tail protein [Deinococcus arcticus]
MEPFIGEIQMFAGNFAPRGWALCNGQLLPIAQNTALFSLLGTTYGGDGRTTFALPNLQATSPMAPGTGPGLTPRTLGQQGGAASVTLLPQEMPPHTHAVNAFDVPGTSAVPTDRSLARSVNSNAYGPGTPGVTLAPQSLAPAGGSAPHNNLPPYLAVTFIIALQGIYPSRP